MRVCNPNQNTIKPKIKDYFTVSFYYLFFINYIVDFSNIEIFTMFMLFAAFFYTEKFRYYAAGVLLYLIIYKFEIEGGYGGFFYVNFIFYSLLFITLSYAAFSYVFKNRCSKTGLVLAAFFLNTAYILLPEYFFKLFYLKIF